jgi:hypothetical protein
MDKRTQQFPASDALHGGRYLDRTLLQFEERKLWDPDKGTKHEGTVHELPPLDDAAAWPTKRISTNHLAATDESAAVAFSGQSNAKRRTLKWLRALPPKKQRQLAEAFPLIRAAL